MADARILVEEHDPYGRRVVLDDEGWQHIVQEHPEMAPHQAAIMAAAARPDDHDDDPRPERERFWRERLGPSRWLLAVVDFSASPARVVTAFGCRDDPPGWWSI